MAGFSLGGGGGGSSHRHTGRGGDQEVGGSGGGIPHDNLFLSAAAAAAAAARSSDVSYTTRGFELWHQPLYPSSSGLLSFASSDQDHAIHGTGHSRRGGSSGSGGGAAGSGMSCQDCGNQAKKDCQHMRCRTCCKSRGFQCSTHVKSTWVPASKRRERQNQLAAAAAAATSSGSMLRSSEPSKRPREISTSAALIVATTASSSGGMEGTLSFPAEVSSPAVFRCMRVSPLDDADEEFAYQTAVSIGGHVFKGILYDHGPDSPSTHGTHFQQQLPSTSTGAAAAVPRLQLPHAESSSSSAAAAIAASAGLGPTASAAGVSAAGLLDPSSLYTAPISAFLAGTQFFPHHPRP